MKRDQTLTVPSREPDTNSESSSEKTRQVTAPKCACHFLSNLPVSTLQSMQATQHGTVNRNRHKLSPRFQLIILHSPTPKNLQYMFRSYFIPLK